MYVVNIANSILNGNEYLATNIGGKCLRVLNKFKD